MLLLQLVPHQKQLLIPFRLVITELLLHLVLMGVLVVLVVLVLQEHLLKPLAMPITHLELILSLEQQP